MLASDLPTPGAGLPSLASLHQQRLGITRVTGHLQMLGRDAINIPPSGSLDLTGLLNLVATELLPNI